MAQDDAPAPRTLAELAGIAGGRLVGDGSIVIRRVGTLENAERGRDRLPRQPPLPAAARRHARVRGDRGAGGRATDTAEARIVADAPYLAYARVAAALYPEARPAPGRPSDGDRRPDRGARRRASPSRRMRRSAPVRRSATAAIVCEGAVVGADAAIGARTRLDANVVVYDRCRLGDDVRVYAGAVIGADGFGLAPARRRLGAHPAGRARGRSATASRSARTRPSTAARSTTP